MFELLLTTQLLAGGLTLVLAGWLLWLRFTSTLTRAFSLFLFLRAMNILLNQFGRWSEDPYWDQVWRDMSGYFVVAVLPALLSFLVVYRMPTRTPRRTVVRTALLASVVVLELFQLADPCNNICFRPGSPALIGPIGVLSFAQTLAFALAGLWLARSYVAVEPGPERAALLWIALALASNGLFEAALTGSLVAFEGWATVSQAFVASPWATLGYALVVGAVIPAVWALVELARAERSAPAGDGRSGWVIGIGLAAPATAIVADRAFAAGGALANLFFPLLGTWRLVMPVLICYAVVRHRLFGIEVKIKGSFGGGTVAAAVLATFFLATELAQNAFEGWSGSVYVGIVVAALLAFLIAPLERLGHRVARHVMPETRAAGPLTEAERIEYFRSQARVAWSSGTLERRDRVLLDDLRERLGLSLDDAARIELDAARKRPGGDRDAR